MEAKTRFFGRRNAESHSDSSEDPAALESLCPGREIDGFRLISFLARGGMGQVWVAEQISLRRKVALKLVLPDRVSPGNIELFAREARAAGRLHHSNIVETFAHGGTGGLTWIAQEWIEGSWTLKDFLGDLRDSETLPVDYDHHIAVFVRKLADALHSAHAAGVIHRDVKPQNILIRSDDEPKLTDFGLARITDETALSSVGDFAGTYFYMSPEQVAAQRTGLDHRTDIFSLGVVLYELLTLSRPFQGDTAQQICSEILHKTPPEAVKIRPGCPAGLARISAKAMEKCPTDRYPSMVEMARDLDRFLTSLPVLAESSRPKKDKQTSPQRTRESSRLWAGGGLLLLASVVLLTFLWPSGKESSATRPSLLTLIHSPPTSSGQPLEALLVARETETFQLPELALPEGVRAEWTSRDARFALVGNALALPQAAEDYEVPLRLTLRESERTQSSDWTLRVEAEDEPGRLEIEAPGRFQEPEGRKSGSYEILTRVVDPEGLPQTVHYTLEVSDDGPPLEIFKVVDNVAFIRPVQWHRPYDLTVKVEAVTTATGKGKATDTIQIQVDADDDPVHIYQTLGNESPVAVGDRVRLMAKARDPEGTDVTYRWEPVDHAIPFVPDFEGAGGIEFDAPVEYAGRTVKFQVMASCATSFSEVEVIEVEILPPPGPAAQPFEGVTYAAPLEAPLALFAESADEAVVFAGWELTADGEPLGTRDGRLATSGFYSALQNEFAANLWANGKDDGYLSLSARRPLPEEPWSLSVELLQNRVQHEDPPRAAEGLEAGLCGTGLRWEFPDGTGLVVGLRNPLDRELPNTLAIWQVFHVDGDWVDQPETVRALGEVTKYQVCAFTLTSDGTALQLAWQIDDAAGDPVELRHAGAPHALSAFAKSARCYLRQLVLDPR